MKSPYPLSIVSGLLIGTSYIPLPPWAIFFCFVPLWFAWLNESSWKRVFLTGWITQFILTLIGFYWVSHTVHEFGHLPWAAAILVLCGFASICTLSIPIAGVVWFFYVKRFRVSGPARIVALVAISCAAERLVPMIFDWHFGYTWLWAKFPAYHLADTIGFIGLSSVGMAFNGLLLHGLTQARAGRRWWPWLATPVVLFGLMNAAGFVRSYKLDVPDNFVNVLMVQANIGNEEKLASEQGAAFRDTVIDRYMKLTEEGVLANAGKVDFAIWPETAFPEFINEPTLSTGYPFKLRQRLTGLRTKLITGGYSILPGTRRPTNSFFVLSDVGQWLTPPYHKTVLLAFGEYFPGANLFPQLREWFPEVADFGRGPGPTVLNAGGLRIGAQICYEGLFDWFTRSLANQGAQVIFNVTNDSWYGDSSEPWQHGWMTLARAVEVRRPLVRSTNTGISTVALQTGEILTLSPRYDEWVHLFEVPYFNEPRPTPFMSWGYWLIPAVLTLTLLGLPLRRKKL